MLLRNDLPNAESKQDNNDPLKKFYSKKEAMKFLDVGRTLFYDYIKKHGLKSCGRGHKIKFHEDDLVDFLMKHRK